MREDEVKYRARLRRELPRVAGCVDVDVASVHVAELFEGAERLHHLHHLHRSGLDDAWFDTAIAILMLNCPLAVLCAISYDNRAELGWSVLSLLVMGGCAFAILNFTITALCHRLKWALALRKRRYRKAILKAVKDSPHAELAKMYEEGL